LECVRPMNPYPMTPMLSFFFSPAILPPPSSATAPNRERYRCVWIGKKRSTPSNFSPSDRAAAVSLNMGIEVDWRL
jgi:hypothetical protein